MKKYDRLAAGAIIVYLCISLLLLFFLREKQQSSNKEYMVEVNRIMQSIKTEAQAADFVVEQNGSIAQVSYLSASQAMDTGSVELFFQNKNGLQSHIQPLVLEGKLQGYVRFDYMADVNKMPQFTVIALFLLMLGIGLIGIMLFIRNQILKPFHELSEMPYQLSKGHLKGELKESKNRFFGKFVWGIAMLRDTLNDAKVRELKLEKEKKMLLLSISHDIKTPVNTIRLYAKALQEDLYDSPEKRREAAIHIGERAEEIEQFVEEIVKTSREEIIAINVKKSEFYLWDYMDMIKKTYEPKCRLMQTSFVVDDAENKLLKGDLDRAVEVFENLMENAFKYGDGKKIHITFYEEEYCQLIKVKNTGIPINTKEMPHLFESFFRGSNAGEKEGNGLGLYICREIMRKMDGEIFAQQEEDGMSFVLVFRE